MTFAEVLDQAIAMLQRRGRLTYRTLQLHFQLDDVHLEALKDELIYGQRLAVDEDGRVLVWTGGADVLPHTTPAVPQPAQPPAPRAIHCPQAVVRSQLHTAREIGETLLRLAHQAHDSTLSVIAHHALGQTWCYLGAFPAARQHLEEGIARYTSDQRRTLVFRMGFDPGVGCRAFAALTLWLLGYPEQALARLHEALALAHALSHPYSLALARCLAAFVSQCRRYVPAVHEHAEATVALATEQGFPLWAALGTSLRGWALAMPGRGEDGMAQVRQGIASFRATGAALYVPYLCTLLAEVADHLGHTQDGLQALAEAHTLVEQQEERYWEAEVYRLRGVLLLLQTGTPQAEAKSLELRAAMSLARLWQQQGKRAEAYDLLAPIYGWFTAGFDTADLQEARALLAALA